MPIGGILSTGLALATAPLAIGGALLGAVAGGAAPAPAGAPATAAPAPTGGVVGTVLGTVLDVALAPVNILGAAVETLTGIAATPGALLTGVLGGAAPANGAAAPAAMQGFGRGNGRTANRTVVQTMDLVTGQIVREQVFPGSPFMMNSDRRAAKRVFRQSQALQKSLPRKTVRESKTTQFKNAAMESAMRIVSCPPKQIACE